MLLSPVFHGGMLSSSTPADVLAVEGQRFMAFVGRMKLKPRTQKMLHNKQTNKQRELML